MASSVNRPSDHVTHRGLSLWSQTMDGAKDLGHWCFHTLAISQLCTNRPSHRLKISNRIMSSCSTSFQSKHQGSQASQDPPRPHTCLYPGCNKTFRRRFTLTEHAKTHSGEKAFLCSVRSCRKSFTTSGNLSRHKRTQHAWLDGPLECLVNDCGCKFSSEAKLERHMTMVHFGASSHACPVKHCGCAFTTAGNLRRHMKQHHNDGSDEEAVTTSSPSAVDQLNRFEPLSVAKWSSNCPQSNATPSTTTDPDADLMAVLEYFLYD